MLGMKGTFDGKPPPRTSYRAALVMIALTAVACLTALVLRTPIRSRYWAQQVIGAQGVAERVGPLTCLCNAGDSGRWGTTALLTHSDDEIRQYGVVVLQHVKSDWSRRRLLAALEDPSESVREMAALGLALHGDETVIPVLKQLFADGDTASAAAACLALERLATPGAIAVLAELASEPADASCRAALVDALSAIGGVDCAAILLRLVDDDRLCEVQPRAQRVLERCAPLAAERGWAVHPTSIPSTMPVAQTVAERAAEGLGRITGLSPPFGSDLSDEQRDSAKRVWREWIGAQRGAP
jgi:HEAT repeat protein